MVADLGFWTRRNSLSVSRLVLQSRRFLPSGVRSTCKHPCRSYFHILLTLARTFVFWKTDLVSSLPAKAPAALLHGLVVQTVRPSSAPGAAIQKEKEDGARAARPPPSRRSSPQIAARVLSRSRRGFSSKCFSSTASLASPSPLQSPPTLQV